MKSIEEHLKDRHMDTDLHTVWISEEERAATFPLWNLTGQMVGYQTYRPDATKDKRNDEKGRYYSYVSGKVQGRKKDRTIAVWGLESWYRPGPLFVFEGIFDAARVTNLGGSAVGLLSNDPHANVRLWLRLVGKVRKTVSVCDDDLAGRKLAKACQYSHFVDTGVPGDDLGSAPESYVRKLLEKY